MSKVVPFEKYADEYDAWFASPRGRKIFESELLAIERLTRHDRMLEIGVGTGIFAERLGVQYGIDPAFQVLRRARQRGIRAVRAVGERLPFKEGIFRTVLIIVTICFLDDVKRGLEEARRVLDAEGNVLVGLVTRDSTWGRLYSEKKGLGHRFYRYAEFYTLEEMVDALEGSGFTVRNHLSTLSQHPNEFLRIEEPGRGTSSEHGFHVIQATKKSPSD